MICSYFRCINKNNCLNKSGECELCNNFHLMAQCEYCHYNVEYKGKHYCISKFGRYEEVEGDEENEETI